MTGLQIKMLIVSVVYGVITGIIAYLITKRVTRASRNSEERITKIVGQSLGAEVVLQKNKRTVKSKFKSRKKTQEKYVQRRSIISKIGDALFEELLAANIMMKPEEFATVWIILAFVPASVISLFSSNFLLLIVLVIAGVVGPIFFIKYKKKKRTQGFEEQLSDALMIACNSLRSGLTFQQAMETISHDMYPPISEEFARAVNEMNMGYTIDEALDNIYKRVKSDDFKIAAVAISVQRTTGGSLSEILETISETIKERYTLKKEIRSATATGRMSGLIVGIMPVIVTLLLNLTSPGYMDPMFEKTAGKIALALGVGLELIGLMVIKKITSIKY